MFNDKNISMKSIKLQTAFCMWLLAVIASGCKQETLNKPLTNNTNAPGVVSNVQVENKNGLAVLTYALPTDGDLFYVRAVYETSPGKSREVIASRYSNTLTVDGFGDTNEHVVKLYAVNSSEKLRRRLALP
jgi:hypothetical protein